MIWKANKKGGNVLKSWTLWHKDVRLFDIRMFKKGEYVLPDVFKRDNNCLPQRTINLSKAKNKCEKWLIEFSKSIIIENKL